MAYNNLHDAGATPANTLGQLLHIGTASVSNAVLRLGDGTETPLRFHAGGIGFTSSTGFACSFKCAAVANLDIEFHPAAGKHYPEIVATLAANSPTTSNTAVAVSSFGATMAAGIYTFEAYLVFQSTGTHAPRFLLTNTATTDFVAYSIDSSGADSLTATAWSTAYGNTLNPPATNTPYLIKVTGICKLSGSGDAGLSIYSETSGQSITLVAGSSMIFRKVN